MHHKKPPTAPRALVVASCLLVQPIAASAAGGHHAVDDAAILDLGQCQLESWADREAGRARSLVHVGPACRLGPVELGLNVDRVRLAGAGAMTTTGPQIKWARSFAPGWSAGLVVSAGWQDESPRYLGSTVVLPVTWQLGEAWTVHVNVGRDLRSNAADDARAGIAFEWAPLSAWTFLAEAFRESRTDHWRLGARWAFTPAVNADLSHARRRGTDARGWWTLGLTWAFER